jgi:hypothetical protein
MIGSPVAQTPKSLASGIATIELLANSFQVRYTK